LPRLDPMRIDSHQHFWRYDPDRDCWITDEMSVLKRDFLPENLIPQLHANQMDGCIAVQADQSERETSFLLDLAAQHQKIKGIVGWVDLCSPKLAERLEYFSKFEKLCGFRHIVQSEPDDHYLVREDFIRGIRNLQEFNFSYDILIYPRQLPAAIELVERIPEQRFVLDHIAKPPIRSREVASWAKQMRELAANRNVHCKVSGLVTEADWHNWNQSDFRPYLDVVFEAFGPDRIMFGSDWPVCLLAGTYEKVKTIIANYVCDLPSEQQAKIFGRNAISFYGLKTSCHEPATAR
jgi:L-fuconolactonase